MGQAVLEWRHLVSDLLAVSTFAHAWTKHVDIAWRHPITNIIMLSVVFHCYAECRYTDCLGALIMPKKFYIIGPLWPRRLWTSCRHWSWHESGNPEDLNVLMSMLSNSFSSSLMIGPNKLECFVPGKHFLPVLVYASKAGAYQRSTQGLAPGHAHKY
jgi:hypothetical protein